MQFRTRALRFAALAAPFILSSCGGGGGGGGNAAPGSSTPTYTVGGSVNGLTGSGLVLRNNGADDRLISSSGSFVFNIALGNNATYSVSVQTQPAHQTCAVANGAGTIAGANVASVVVNCLPITFTLGGAVSGMAGSGLVLRNNGGDDRSISTNGIFAFTTPVNSGTNYAVTVATQPLGQSCVVTNGTGTASANVSNVAVTCTTVPYSVGGTVTGLAGTGFTIQNNTGDDIVINANGAFAFPAPLTSGQSYNVTQVMPPSNPVQSCTITNGSGTINAANVTDIAITCETHRARFLFTANATDGTVSTYAINDATGQLSPRTIAKTGANPLGVVGERSRRSLYVVNRNSANVTGFDIEANTAVLTEKPSSPYQTGVNVLGTFAHPSGSYFYYPSSSSNNLTAYAIDATTGALNAVPGSPYSGSAATSIAQDPNGRFMYEMLPAGEIKIDSVNATTGALTEVGRTTVPGSPPTLVMYKSGRYLYATSSTQGVYGFSVHPTTGLLTPLPGFPFLGLTSPSFAGVHTSGRFFYFRESAVNGHAVVVINPATGALSMGPNSPYISNTSLNIFTHWSGRFLYGANSTNGIYAFSINTDTGATTPVPGSPFAAPGAILPYVEPSGKYLYVATGALNRVLTFSINQTTGALTPLPNQPSLNIGRGATGWLLSAFTNGLSFRSDFAYTANAGDHTVSAFAIDNASGKMTPIGSTATGGLTPLSVTMDMRARFLYTMNSNSNDISAFRIGSTGTLTAVTASPIGAGTTPTSMTVDPSSRFAYVTHAGATEEIRAYQIDQATGALSALVGSPYSLLAGSLANSLVMHPNGLFVYTVNRGNNSIAGFAIDQTTGGLIASPGSVATQSGPSSMAIDPSGRFAYVVNETAGSVSMYSISATTGALSPLGTPTVVTSAAPRGIAMDPAGRFVYVGNTASNTINAFAINPVTGVLTQITGSPFATATPSTGLKVDYSGKYLHASSLGSNQVQSYSIDATTGALTAIASSVVATGIQPQDVVISTRTQ